MQLFLSQHFFFFFFKYVSLYSPAFLFLLIIYPKTQIISKFLCPYKESILLLYRKNNIYLEYIWKYAQKICSDFHTEELEVVVYMSARLIPLRLFIYLCIFLPSYIPASLQIYLSAYLIAYYTNFCDQVPR